MKQQHRSLRRTDLQAGACQWKTLKKIRVRWARPQRLLCMGSYGMALVMLGARDARGDDKQDIGCPGERQARERKKPEVGEGNF